MAKRIGKYKITNRESEVSLRDGGKIDGAVTITGDATLSGGGTLTGTKNQIVGSATGASVTLTAAQSGATVFVGGGARVITLPVVEAGLNFKLIFATAHAHVISSSVGTSLLNYTGIDNTNGSTIARTSFNSKQAITLANCVLGEQLECVTDGTEWYIKGDLNDTPTAT